MPRFTPEFTTGMGPDNPRNQPDAILFPSKTSDGPAQTVSRARENSVQPGTGAREGMVVPMNKPNLNLQINRVYSPSRRRFPRAV